MNARDWIEQLGLIEHPEGGYFREIYRSGYRMAEEILPFGIEGEHSLGTSIYFLITHEKPSHFHRLTSDEVWFFHEGSPVTLHFIETDGTYRQLELGRNPDHGETFQQTVPAGTWFGATVEEPEGFGLTSCVVFPGFEFSDFELGKRSDLLRSFPEHQGIIERLTASG